jgi:hypothetical protein
MGAWIERDRPRRGLARPRELREGGSGFGWQRGYLGSFGHGYM